MSGTRNWNEMSSSDEDSWFEDEEQQPQKPVQAAETAQNPQTQENKPKVQEQKLESIPKPVQQKAQQPKKQEIKKQRKFLKDQQLLNQYINKTVDDPRVIKAARVASQQHKNLLTSLSNARAREVKDGLFIINFNQPEDLIAFIKDKIANKYRFFLQPYFKRKVEERQPRQHRKYNEERNNQKEKGDKKAQDKPKEEEKKKQRRKPRYEDEDEEDQKKEKKSKTYVERKNQSKEQKEKQKKPQKQLKKSEKNKEQDKSKKVYIAKETFEITKDNNLLIKSQNFEWQKVIQQLESKKIFKDFKRVKITTPFAPTKLIKLLSEIAIKHKFFLDKPFPEGLKQEDSFYLQLHQNGPNLHLKAMHDKYSVRASRYQKQDSDEDRKPQKNNHDREQKKIIQQKSEQKPRLLGSNFNEYFNNIEKSNENEIDKGFDENEFVRRLKQNDRQIFEKNKCWKISAQQELIQSLLKLTHRLTKSTVYDVSLKIAIRSEKSILIAELTPRPEQKRRPKVDVSGVNGYLS